MNTPSSLLPAARRIVCTAKAGSSHGAFSSPAPRLTRSIPETMKIPHRAIPGRTVWYLAPQQPIRAKRAVNPARYLKKTAYCEFFLRWANRRGRKHSAVTPLRHGSASPVTRKNEKNTYSAARTQLSKR